ncbi:MAG TPA: hypothetical protein VFH89_12110 [Sphingomicrobium sp.]|nr:hypothetical protein [Sphingomicrobium sp.]
MLKSAKLLKFSAYSSCGICGLRKLEPGCLSFEIFRSLEEQLLDLGILRAHRKLAAMLCLRAEFGGVDDLHDVEAIQ